MSLDSPPTLTPTEVASALAGAKASNPDLYQRMLATLTPEETPTEHRPNRPAIDASHVGNSGDEALLASAYVVFGLRFDHRVGSKKRQFARLDLVGAPVDQAIGHIPKHCRLKCEGTPGFATFNQRATA